MTDGGRIRFLRQCGIIFAAVFLVLGVVGIVGVAYQHTQRTSKIVWVWESLGYDHVQVGDVVPGVSCEDSQTTESVKALKDGLEVSGTVCGNMQKNWRIISSP